MKKFILFLFLPVIINGYLKAAPGDFDETKFERGKGIESDPFIINSSEHLKYLCTTVNENKTNCSNGVFFKLGRDIISWIGEDPIGNSLESAFTGNFDGDGFTIRDFRRTFTIYEVATVTGLFGYTGMGAKIQNLTIEGGHIYNEQGEYAGVVIARAENTIVENCHVKNFSINVSARYSTGGFIGYAEKIIVRNCSSEGTVFGSNDVGGFIGQLQQPSPGWSINEIKNCRSSCNVNGTKNIGGFIGCMQFFSDNAITVIIESCHSTGSVLGLMDNAGGFIGACLNSQVDISKCYSTGDVIGASNYVGGFIGYNNANNIERCYSSGSVTGLQNAGGFIGSSQSFSISNSAISYCYAVGTVKADQNVAAFIGDNYKCNITQCFAAGAVITDDLSTNYEEENFIAGFVGFSMLSNYSDCYFDTQTTGRKRGFGFDDLQGINPFYEISQNSFAGFSLTDWIFNIDYYPQLKYIIDLPQNPENIEIKLRSALSSVPFKPSNSSEFNNDLKTVVQLPDKTSGQGGYDISWIADPADNVTIINNAVYAKDSEAWRKLSLRVGQAERSVQFRSTNGMTSAEIMNVIINHEPHSISDAPFTYLIKCGEPDISVFAEIILTPYSECIPGSPISLKANEPTNITVYALNRAPKEYTFIAKKPLPEEIYVQRWDDVLAINNDFATNGGYNFVEYEWEMNGQPLAGETKGYIYMKQPATYSAKVYYYPLQSSEKKELDVCPITINNTSSKAAIYPNPVRRGATLQVEMEAKSTALIQIYNSSGNIISKQTINSYLAEIVAPDEPGNYIIQITTNDSTQSFKITVE